MTAKFVVGGTLVTATMPADETLSSTEYLVITHESEEWIATTDMLKESYTPVSDTAEYWYECIVP